MSYFDDNENRIIHGGRRRKHDPVELNRRARKALAAPAGSELAASRIAAHAAFDPLWKSGRFSRGVAYEWLANELDIPVAQCHMVLFDVEQCRKVVAICQAHPAARQAAIDAVADDFEVLP